MGPEHVLVLNGDDPYIAQWDMGTSTQIVRFSVRGNTHAEARFCDGALFLGDAVLFQRDQFRLLGNHNVANALAAALAAKSFGVDHDTIRQGLLTYDALPHRLRTVAIKNGIRWVNDSKATNPNAAAAALNAMDTPTILLAGGSIKDADFTSFGKLVRRQTKAVVLFGQTRNTLASAIGQEHPMYLVESLEEAVNKAQRLACSGDTVLLSPACASFDQFTSYAHRGEVFEDLVKATAT